MRRVFRTRTFSRWMRKCGLSDVDLCESAAEMAQGLLDAELGGGVVKKRVALPGRGKRGSARTIVATNRGTRWFFIFGFEKSERDSINARDLSALQGIAAELLSLPNAALDKLVAAGELKEICHDDEA